MIREFRPDDARPCCELIRASIRDDRSIDAPVRALILESESPESVRERARLYYLAVYESEGSALGVAGLDLNEVRLLFVSPGHRRRGIGRALMRAFLEGFRGTVYLEVRESNQAARAFYKSLGFQEITIRPRYYEAPQEAAIVMKFLSC